MYIGYDKVSKLQNYLKIVNHSFFWFYCLIVIQSYTDYVEIEIEKKK